MDWLTPALTPAGAQRQDSLSAGLRSGRAGTCRAGSGGGLALSSGHVLPVPPRASRRGPAHLRPRPRPSGAAPPPGPARVGSRFGEHLPKPGTGPGPHDRLGRNFLLISHPILPSQSLPLVLSLQPCPRSLCSRPGGPVDIGGGSKVGPEPCFVRLDTNSFASPSPQQRYYSPRG